MGRRRYSVAEIEHLERIAEEKYLGLWPLGQAEKIQFSRSYQESDKIVAVQEQVRTWMANGTTPEQLQEHALEQRARK